MPKLKKRWRKFKEKNPTPSIRRVPTNDASGFPNHSEPFACIEDLFGASAKYDGTGTLSEVDLPNFGTVDITGDENEWAGDLDD